jgi:hypothetical protein
LKTNLLVGVRVNLNPGLVVTFFFGIANAVNASSAAAVHNAMIAFLPLTRIMLIYKN